jgi:uncharacterized protein with GYD domain
MPTYVFLTRWTDRGIVDSSGSVSRVDAAVERMERLGVRIFETYWTVGEYDLLLVADCPDVETAHAVTLDLGSRGNVRATAMRAFDAGEMRDLLDKLGKLDDG